MLKEFEICTKCGDGWMVSRDGKLVCTHCGYECTTEDLKPRSNGRVTNVETGNPIAGVLITLDGMSAITDPGGNYALKGGLKC